MAKNGPNPIRMNHQQLGMVEKLSGQGLTPKQICAFMGFSYTTFYKLKRNQKEFDHHYERGKARGLAIVANALFENAKEGDTSAQIFYLKARDQSQWNPKVIVDAEIETREITEITLTIVDDINT